MKDFLTPEEFASATGGKWLDPAPASIGGVAIDTRGDLTGKMFLALRGEKSDGHAYLDAAKKSGAEAAMIERRECTCDGLPRLLVADVQAALTAAAVAWRKKLRCRTVAITGSAGKTTTRRLLAAAFEPFGLTHSSPKSFNNHLGVPLTILSAPRDTKFLAVEIGMNHAGEIEPLAKLTRPEIALIVNSGSTHLGGLGSREAIAREKCAIARGLDTSGIFVIHGDSPGLTEIARTERLPAGGVLQLFGQGGMCLWRLRSREVAADGTQKLVVQGPRCEIRFTLRLPGHYNAINATGAIAVIGAMGLDPQRAADAMSAVVPSEGRMVRERVGQIEVYNDSYNANPEAVLAAVASFAEVSATALRRVVALGDMLELGEESRALHRMVGEKLASAFDGKPPDLLMTSGPLSAEIAQSLKASSPQAQVEMVTDLAAEAPRLARLLKDGDALLIKGSRVSGMERLLEVVRSAKSPAEIAKTS
ncbi:MAG: UDP-N-acetylmuramoyl-tripeptide--D-alanyl-D-alanine ligase [Planctomycetes bacterium]|nr:UDP-N-acetylmuramoyl-tripeptide--D-alanyl-D-alanine ligase [Planctomycetota bacterium]